MTTIYIYSIDVRSAKRVVDVVLVYPYFNPKRDRSIFRVPPLGLGYVASYLEHNGVEVDLVDCTFLEEAEAIRRVKRLNPQIVGIYSMFSLRENALRVARAVKGSCDLLVAGGPLPTVDPYSFTDDFNIVVKGEGERTMFEVTESLLKGEDYSRVPGILYLKNGEAIFTGERQPYESLDEIPFPARHLFPNTDYQILARKERRG